MSYGATWWCGAEHCFLTAGRSGGQIPHIAGAFLYGFYMFCMVSCQVLGFFPQASNITLVGFG